MTAPTVAGDLAPLYRETLAAVRDALDIPHAATAAWGEKRSAILDERIMHVVTMLRRILGSDDAEVVWHVAYLRERLAELPLTGYVTVQEAHAAVERGMSWAEAVAEPRERVACGPGCISPDRGRHDSFPGPAAGRQVVDAR